MSAQEGEYKTVMTGRFLVSRDPRSTPHTQCIPFGLAPLLWLLCLLAPANASAQANQQIYTDSLQNGWVSYGWAAAINYADTSTVHSGANSISVTINSTPSAWDAIYIHHDAFDSTPYSNITFWVNGGPTGGQQVQLQAIIGTSAQPGVYLSPLPTNTWQQI